MDYKRFRNGVIAAIVMLALLIFPAFADDLAGSDAGSMMLIPQGEYPESVMQAAAQLREGMKNREESIEVSFQLNADSFDGTQASVDELARQIIDLAYLHTGVPNEGDYLRWSVGGVGFNTSFSKIATGWSFQIHYNIVYYANAQQEAELDIHLAELVETLELTGGDLTDFQKVYAIYDYICRNVAYDHEHWENPDPSYVLHWSAYAALVNKTAVCQGYATLFYRLALEAGIDSRIIVGPALNAMGETEDHAWNLVQLDGQYYLIDSTWDSENYDYQWFLKSSIEFYNHKPEAAYQSDAFLSAYPVASESYRLPVVESAFDGDFEYRVFAGSAVLLKYHGTDAEVTVPARLGGYPVHWIGSGAFSFNFTMANLTFSEGIRMIESSAILECYALKSIHLPSTVDFTASKDPNYMCRVICGTQYCPAMETITVAEGNPNLTVYDGVLYNKEMTILRYCPEADPREVFEIPEGVISIGAAAFFGNKNLKEVKMPDSVRMLTMSCFENCSNLEKINIPNQCTYIGQFIFSNTALESIHIPASVEQLYYGSFGENCMLKTITVDPENPYFYVQDGVLYGHYTEGIQVNSCNMPGDWLVKFPAGSDITAFTVPEGIIGIEQDAFDGCIKLNQITLPDSLEMINSTAFRGCTALTEIKLPPNLRSIENSPFAECSNLAELIIPPSVEHLGYYVLTALNLENIVFLGDAPELSDQTFAICSGRICYPHGNTTWDRVIQMYAGVEELTWIEACETHQFTEKIIEASCTNYGYTGQECSVCGLIEVSGEVIPAAPHNWEFREVIPPRCEEYSGTLYCCTACGTTKTDDLAYPFGHSYDENGVCARCVEQESETGIDSGSALSGSGKWAVVGVTAGFITIVTLISKKKRKVNTTDANHTD